MSGSDQMRVLIVRLGALGDVVHTIPVVAALARRLPEAVVDWVIDERCAPLLDLVPGLGRRVVLRTRGRSTVAAWTALRQALREVAYDVALDVQGLGKSALAARLSGARRVVGFGAPFLREPWARWLYTETADPGRPRHVVDRNLGILAALGVADRDWSFPIRVGESPEVEALRRRFDPPGGCVLINPNAAWPTKRWPPACYGAVAAHVARAPRRWRRRPTSPRWPRCCGPVRCWCRATPGRCTWPRRSQRRWWACTGRAIRPATGPGRRTTRSFPRSPTAPAPPRGPAAAARCTWCAAAARRPAASTR